MERQTFILTTKKDFRRFVRIFLKDKNGKNEQRNITFTTEHKVSEKQRNTVARTKAAEFSTSDERLYDGILRSPAYGKTYILKGDDGGKLKKEPFNITPLDAKKIALKNLFETVSLEFDETKSAEVLEEEYQIFVNAKTGKKIEKDPPLKVTHTPVDVEKQMADQANAARGLYKEKYGEDIPEAYANDRAFLSALSDPDFDAKAYMAKEESSPKTIEDIRAEYLEVVGVNVANPKKNDAAWMKQKIAEKKGGK